LLAFGNSLIYKCPCNQTLESYQRNRLSRGGRGLFDRGEERFLCRRRSTLVCTYSSLFLTLFAFQSASTSFSPAYSPSSKARPYQVVGVAADAAGRGGIYSTVQPEGKNPNRTEKPVLTDHSHMGMNMIVKLCC